MKLLDNTIVNELDIRFDPNSYHFHLQSTGRDITNLLTRAQKLLLVPDFDVDKENYRLSREKGAGKYGNDELDESTLGNLGTQVMRDGVFVAPLETLDNTVSQFARSSGVQLFAVAAAVYVYFKFFRK